MTAYTPLASCQKRAIIYDECVTSPGPLPAVIERMKLGLLADELLGTGLDGDKI
jgi:hypothetical protein